MRWQDIGGIRNEFLDEKVMLQRLKMRLRHYKGMVKERGGRALLGNEREG